MTTNGEHKASARVPRFALLAEALVFVTLLLQAHLVVSQCVQSGWTQDGGYEGNCTKCAADGLRCEACDERFALAASGECVACNVTVIGPHSHRCSVCRADDPSVCLKCENYCNSRGCTGYFVTREGRCSICPAGAAACEDLTGGVRECRMYYGLVGGECRRCKDERCELCNGDVSVCTQCQVPHVRSQGGYYSDPATGACKPCKAGCRACNGPDNCLDCTYTVLDPISQACPPCTASGCKACGSSLDTCDECADGHWLDDSGKCIVCTVPNCKTCDGNGNCTECTSGYGLVLSDCKRCAGADAGCAACDGDPAVCKGCANDTFPDPATGACGPCRVTNCSSCQDDDATRCADFGVFCVNGTHFSNETGACLPCTAAGCWSCAADTPDRCDSCVAGFYREEPTDECKPCADAACEACDVSQGAACDGCSNGHYLEASTKGCKPCSGPDGSKYDSCKGISPPAATERSALN